MTINATQILETLDPQQIAERLEQLDAEAKALRVLLRAARQRERIRPREETIKDVS